MEETLIQILNENFNVPKDIDGSADLRQYLVDSIDVGELVAILNDRLTLALKLVDFKDVYTLKDIIALIEKSNKN